MGDSISKIESDSNKKGLTNDQISKVISIVDEIKKTPEAITETIKNLADSIALNKINDTTSNSKITNDEAKNTFKIVDSSLSLKDSEDKNNLKKLR